MYLPEMTPEQLGKKQKSFDDLCYFLKKDVDQTFKHMDYGDVAWLKWASGRFVKMADDLKKAAATAEELIPETEYDSESPASVFFA